MQSKNSRREAREWAVQMLCSADLNPPADVATLTANFWQQLSLLDAECGGPVKCETRYRRFAETRVEGVLAHRAEIDAALGEALENWDLYRLGTVERAVLRLGYWELKYAAIPAAIVINEAIEVERWFSTLNARSVINGVLDRLAKTVVPAAAGESPGAGE